MPPHTIALLLAAVSILSAPYAAAHIPWWEDQMLKGPTGTDWTLEAPFMIPLDASQGWTPSLENSRVFFSVLGVDPTDIYDAASFEVVEGGPQYAVGLAAYPPACAAYDNFYPSVALLGPLSDPRFTVPTTPLPFELPPGYGAIIRNQPRSPTRFVFADNPVQGYYLPSPLVRDCILTAEAFAACDNGTAVQTSAISQLPGVDAPLAPGKYYVVWWDPERMSADAPPYTFPHEVVVSLGVGEDPSQKEQELQLQAMTGQVLPVYAACAPPGMGGMMQAGAGGPPRPE